MPILQLKYTSKISIVCVWVTVEIQFDNTSAYKYSIILTLRSVAILPCAFGAPIKTFSIRP